MSCLKRRVISCRIWNIVIQFNNGANKPWKVNDDFSGALPSVNVNVNKFVKWGCLLKKLLVKCFGSANQARCWSSTNPTVVEVRLLAEVALMFTKIKQSWCLCMSPEVYLKMTDYFVNTMILFDLSWWFGLAIKVSEHM